MDNDGCTTKVGSRPVFQSRGELLGEPDLFIELTDGKKPGIRRQRGRGKLDFDWLVGEEIE